MRKYSYNKKLNPYEPKPFKIRLDTKRNKFLDELHICLYKACDSGWLLTSKGKEIIQEIKVLMEKLDYELDPRV